MFTSSSWQELLMEAARRYDEAQHAVQSAAITGRVIAFPTPPAHAASFEAAAAPPPATVARAISWTWDLDAEPAVPADEPTAATPSGPIPTTGGPVAVTDSPATTSSPDLSVLLEEATTCYLRRDLARAEAILQQCLAACPGDKRVLQNLERIRRKKSP